MPIINSQVYALDRRQLLKLTGTMGIGATFISPTELWANGTCDHLTVSEGSVQADKATATLQYWIDGLHFGGRSDLKSRANISLFMNLTQTDASYVESVVLMDAKSNTIGARYFDASMKMRDHGYVPYVRFENLELDPLATYTCIYAVRSGSDVKLYTSSIVKPTLSTLDATFLPPTMRADFESFLAGNAANPTPGLITNPFQYYTAGGLTNHCARGRLTSMTTDGTIFTVNIDFMHADQASDHYMRYFIVMDPVGRFLGLTKRTYGDSATGSLNVGRLDDATRTMFNITDLQVANIADCPYIQIFTDDCYDGLARSVLRLR